MVRCAKAFGLKVRAYHSSWRRLIKRPGPGIRLCDGGYLMFGKANEAQVLVQNPLLARPMLMSRAEFEAVWGERFAREMAQFFRRLARPCVICPSRPVVADIYRRGFGIEAGDIEFLDYRGFAIACQPKARAQTPVDNGVRRSPHTAARKKPLSLPKRSNPIASVAAGTLGGTTSLITSRPPDFTRRRKSTNSALAPVTRVLDDGSGEALHADIVAAAAGELQLCDILGQQMPAEHGELACHSDCCDLMTTSGSDTQEERTQWAWRLGGSPGRLDQHGARVAATALADAAMLRQTKTRLAHSPI